MGKSFDRKLESKIQIRDGQSVWANMFKRISSQYATANTANNVELRVYPYAKLLAGLDLCKDIDADPLHCSLPSGTYYGIAYTHSDNCLKAKYPEIAAGIEPIVEYFIKTQYAVKDQVLVDLVIDAIGALIVTGTEIYGTALCEYRATSAFRAKDETNFDLGLFLFGGSSNIYPGQDMGKVDGKSATNAGAILLDEPYNASNRQSELTTVESLHTESQSWFDTNINSQLIYCFLTPTVKTICELLYGTVIKMRYADADTNRFALFYPDNFLSANNLLSNSQAAAYIKNLVTNHVKVILDRYTFMPELMRSLGFMRLSGAKPSDTTVKTDRIIINTANNSLSLTYDEADVIKNIIDHNGITYDEINAQLLGTTTTAHEAYLKNMFTEANSYLNNELELGDSILINDGILSVLLHDGLRLYSSWFVDIYKANGSSVDNWTITVGYPKPLIKEQAATFSTAVTSDITALNELICNTSLIDATWVPVITEDNVLIKLIHEHVNCGINTYTAPAEDIGLISSYAITYILFNSPEVLKKNEILRKDPNLNNNAQ